MKKEDLLLKSDLISCLPILPRTLCELVELSQSKEINLKELKSLLLRDVCLCVKALDEINSTEGKKAEVDSLDSGIATLDLEKFLIKCLSSPLYDQNSEEGVWLNQFNRRSIIAASACRLIGEEKGCQDLEELYLCGLLHDLGILFLRTGFPEEYALVLERKNNAGKLSNIEKEILATDHLEFGEKAIKDWNFPQSLKKVIERHECCGDDDPETFEIAHRIVGVAEQLSEVLFVETEPKALEELAKDWEKRIKLSAKFFKKVSHRLWEQINSKASSAQAVPVNAAEIVLQAHNQISRLYQSYEEKMKEKFRGLTRKNEEERKKAELEALKVILATFSHYINNATTSIMGRSQLIDIAIKKGDIKDENGKISNSMKIIQQGVENITAVLNGLKKLDSFRTIRYHERSNIIDLRDKVEIKGL